MNLPFEHKVVIMVWYSDLEDFIKQHYGKRTNMARLWEAGQETIWDLEIRRDFEQLDPWPADSAEEAEKILADWQADETPDPYERRGIDPLIVMWDMCRRGVVPECDLKVHVWW